MMKNKMNMKQYINQLYVLAFLLVLAGCSNDSVTTDIEEAELIQIEELNLKFGELSLEEVSADQRYVEGYAVNTPTDPTSEFFDRFDWILEFKFVKSDDSVYEDGEANFTNKSGMWVPDIPIYFPSYKYVMGRALFRPKDWNGEISKDQSTKELIKTQDVQKEPGSGQLYNKPAHILYVGLWHKHSMLDFIIDNADEDHIDKVEVHIGDDIYQPYKVAHSDDKIEYLLIFPTESNNPKIKLYTKDGARYTEDIKISYTQPDVAYCLTLNGLELKLSTVTVADWTTGKALSGEYISTVSYPTFQGEENATYTLQYDTGLKQEVKMNENGERTIKPLGRTVVKVEKDKKIVDTNIVLRSMVIDLLPLFE